MNLKMLIIFGIILGLALPLISAREITCADNPTQLWHFNEGTGTNAEDKCYGYNATFYGNMIWANGKYGNAVEFNGIDSYIDAGNIYPFNQNMPEFSFSLWVNFSNYNIPAYQTLFRSGYYNPATEFIEAIQINEGDNNYVIFMGSNSINIKIIDDGFWHNIIGTFNGTSQSSKLYIDGDFIMETFLGYSEITATTSPLGFGYNFDNGFVLNGTLDEIAFFNRTLTQEEIIDYYSTAPLLINVCSNQTEQQLILPTYPYADLNTNYPLQYFAYADDILSYIGNVSIDITQPDENISTFNFIWNDGTNGYDLTLLFTEIGDYSFTIYSTCPYTDNVTGIFLVRQPFNITFCAFEEKDLTPYINDFAYLVAEFTSSKRYYDTNLEQFITPLGFATTYKTPVFHTFYRDGCGTLKLYEDEEYAVRLFDGVATYQTTFSAPNISKTYGTNIYFGKYTLNSASEDINILLSSKDIHQYRWLANWIFIIAVVFCIIVSVGLFFVIPQMPSLSIIFGVGFITMLILARIMLWFFLGW